MSEHNPKPMNKEELEKYIERDFLPSLLSKFPNIPDLVAENAHLKAEVERLEKGIQPEGSNDAVGRAVELLLEKEKETARLKAEVERLRKAGDDILKDNLNHFTDSNHIAEWNAAKEGKQS